MTWAANQSSELRPGETQVQGQLALGGVDEAGVVKTHLHTQTVPGLVVQTIVRVETPGPGVRRLDRILW